MAGTKPNLRPKRYHFYSALLFILGTLFPPLAVAARFGIGGDFFLNLLLTLCGYIPGHAHNFYIQNIRNNKTHRRTPKWAQRYGLVDTSELKRKERKNQWASRYNERLPRSTLEGQSYEEGQEPDAPSVDSAQGRRRGTTDSNGNLWSPTEERFYGQNDRSSASVDTSNSGRWHYPANFEDTIPTDTTIKKKKKKDKKDRWERTADAYSLAEETPRRKKSKKKRGTADVDSTYSRGSTNDFPEDPEGGLYGPSRPAQRERDLPDVPNGNGTSEADVFSHQF
ncbi:hypothetical protein PUNSTDRAFT_127096 [Punctularia strigosozonata HHB-11173 SS5]|uniref:uncharacterized protein n=1 Tax=Punctularia strigosozonata (strain HHB-11173) TaxID=741275 RepID=UPI00044186E6|nr:uncharacterized protein PUNSTDRAFT_127096 [Punctularia strigosozonata HHB-11173 SS5]EIN07361.1 hypothetical protein PUNSTDRAFT_127096 [Punctularia strigosozonata HHB-11173 SS5]